MNCEGWHIGSTHKWLPSTLIAMLFIVHVIVIANAHCHEHFSVGSLLDFKPLFLSLFYFLGRVPDTMSVSQSWAEGYSRSSNSSCEATSYQRNVDQAALVFDTRLSSRALETLFTLDFHFWAHTSFSATHLHHPCPALLERVLSRGRGHMYTYSWFRLMYGRNQQTQFCKTLVFQLKIKNLKEEMNKGPFPPTFKKKQNSFLHIIYIPALFVN